MLFKEERKEINVDLPTHLFHIYYFNNHLVTGFEFRLNLAQWEETCYIYVFIFKRRQCVLGWRDSPFSNII